MNDLTKRKSWWSRRVWKLPVWAWIIVVISIVGALGSNGNSTNTTSTENSARQEVESSSPEIDETLPPSKPSLTVSQENAIEDALRYLDTMAFSKQGLIDQLSSEYGGQFSLADSKFAVAFIEKDPGVNWNSQAARAAKEYLATLSFSCNGLIDQLSSEYGSKFTRAEATYGATQVGLC